MTHPPARRRPSRTLWSHRTASAETAAPDTLESHRLPLHPDNTTGAEAAPWPAGLAEAGNAEPTGYDPDGSPVYSMPHVKPTELLTLADVRTAVAHLLHRHQDHLSISWRTDVWFGEEDAARALRISRTAVAYAEENNRAHHPFRPADVPSTGPANRSAVQGPTIVPLVDAAMDTLVLAFNIRPQLLLTTLSLTGINHRTAADTDYHVALTLLGRLTQDPDHAFRIRNAGLHLSRIPHLRDALGVERFELLLALGWKAHAIEQAAAAQQTDPDLLPLDALRTLAALHSGA